MTSNETAVVLLLTVLPVVLCGWYFLRFTPEKVARIKEAHPDSKVDLTNLRLIGKIQLFSAPIIFILVLAGSYLGGGR